MVRAKLGGLSWFAIRPGHRVAIAAGSRGIADIAEILRAIVEFLKSLEADPFLFPAMDSHGLATVEGAGCHSGAVGCEGSICLTPRIYRHGQTQITVVFFKYQLIADHYF